MTCSRLIFMPLMIGLFAPIEMTKSRMIAPKPQQMQSRNDRLNTDIRQPVAGVQPVHALVHDHVPVRDVVAGGVPCQILARCHAVEKRHVVQDAVEILSAEFLGGTQLDGNVAPISTLRNVGMPPCFTCTPYS